MIVFNITLKLSQIIPDLVRENPDIVSIANNIQPNPNNIIFGDETEIIYGRKYIEDYFCNLKIRIGLTSFFQINLLMF